jgi:hypothetical protein
MLSNKAARTLVTAIIIAFHHAIFENNGSVTGVTAWRDWGIVMRIRRYTGRTSKFENFVSIESFDWGCGGEALFDQWLIRLDLAKLTLVRAFPRPLDLAR